MSSIGRAMSRSPRVTCCPVRIASTVERGVVGRVSHPQRRVESPAEGAVEDSATRNPGVGGEERVPVPSRSVPARTAGHIDARGVDVGFGQILRTERAEAVQVRLLKRVLVELRGLERSVVLQLQLMAFFDLDLTIAVL